MTAKQYLEIVKKAFSSFQSMSGWENSIYMVMQDDNIPRHAIKVVRAYLNRQKVKTCHGPDTDPDTDP